MPAVAELDPRLARRRGSIRSRGRRRLAVLCAGVGTAAVAGGYAALRQSSVFAVTAVTVSGAKGAKAAEVQGVAARAVAGESLLAVDGGSVADSIARLPYVRDVTVDRGFPHTLTLSVDLYRPYAAVVMPGRRGAYLVAGGGEITEAVAKVPSGLPRIVLPAGSTLVVGRVTGDANVEAALHVLRSAPRSFTERVGPLVRVEASSGQVRATVRR